MAALNNSDGCNPSQPKFLLCQSLPQTLQPSEFVILVVGVMGHRKFVSCSKTPCYVIPGPDSFGLTVELRYVLGEVALLTSPPAPRPAPPASAWHQSSPGFFQRLFIALDRK